MPTSLDPTAVCNVALSKIGMPPINALNDQTSQSAIICNNNWGLAYLEVSRASRWNCILNTATLAQVPQTPLPGCTPPPNPATWAPNTTYQANTYLTYGGYYYQVMFTYTSTVDFTNDLTTGALTQTNLPTSQPFFPPNGSNYASGWSYAYQLPTDFQLLCALNDNTYWNGTDWSYGDQSSDYEIIGPLLYCDEPQAVIQYVQNTPDTTRFDSLMMSCITFKLAALVSTPLRQDGGVMEQKMLEAYEVEMRRARVKNAGEKQARRFNPIGTSLFNAARYRSSNG